MLATKPNPIEAVTPRLRLVARAPQWPAFGGWESRLTAFAAAHSGMLLRLSLAAVFCGFGALKVFPGASPAEHLAGKTLHALTLGLLPQAVCLPLLGLFELAIGVSVLTAPRARFTIPALLAHLAGTLTPFLLFPSDTFAHFPFPSLVGQYILKNVVLVAAGLAILGGHSSNREVASAQ